MGPLVEPVDGLVAHFLELVRRPGWLLGRQLVEPYVADQPSVPTGLQGPEFPWHSRYPTAGATCFVLLVGAGHPVCAGLPIAGSMKMHFELSERQLEGLAWYSTERVVAGAAATLSGERMTATNAAVPSPYSNRPPLATN